MLLQWRGINVPNHTLTNLTPCLSHSQHLEIATATSRVDYCNKNPHITPESAHFCKQAALWGLLHIAHPASVAQRLSTIVCETIKSTYKPPVQPSGPTSKLDFESWWAGVLVDVKTMTFRQSVASDNTFNKSFNFKKDG
jgi:hypothetical protein